MEEGSGSLVSVRGHGSFVQRAPWRKRLLALATDTPFHLLAPFIGIFLLNQPPLPGPAIFGLWAGWMGLVHFFQRKIWGCTLGERAWGIRKFPRQGTLEKHASDTPFQLSAFVLLGVALFVSTMMLQTILLFHPMLRHATREKLASFEPAAGDEGNWTRLPFYLALGQFPRSVNGNLVWYQLPYSKGPPTRFPARVVIRLPRQESRLTLEGPRTPDGLRGRREEIRNCLVSPAIRTRLSPGCLATRRNLFQRHALEIRPGGQSPVRWEMQWFEVDRPIPPRGELPTGIRLTARNGNELVHRFILITSEGQHQAMTLETRATAENPEGDLELLEKLVGSLTLHPDLGIPLDWLEQRMATTSLATIRTGGTLDQLGHASALLISQATVDPGAPDTYFELAGISLALLKKSASMPASETVAAVARPQVRAAQKLLQDVAPEDARNGQLEQTLLELKQF